MRFYTSTVYSEYLIITQVDPDEILFEILKMKKQLNAL